MDCKNITNICMCGCGEKVKKRNAFYIKEHMPKFSSVLAEIYSKITKQDNDCWLWLGPISKDNTCNIVRRSPDSKKKTRYNIKKIVYSHYFDTTLHPTKDFIRNNCNTFNCCNPQHLYIIDCSTSAKTRRKNNNVKPYINKNVLNPIAEKITYIYVLIDPRDNNIRYVGKTVNPKKRLENHLVPSRLRTISHKNSWIKDLLKNNLKPKMVLLETIEIGCNWEERELYWISYFKQNSEKDLTNYTDGGVLPPVMPHEHYEKLAKIPKVIKLSKEELHIRRSNGQKLSWERRKTSGTNYAYKKYPRNKENNYDRIE